MLSSPLRFVNATGGRSGFLEQTTTIIWNIWKSGKKAVSRNWNKYKLLKQSLFYSIPMKVIRGLIKFFLIKVYKNIF